MLTGALSNQLGAASGALAFPVIGPAGVVAVRQWIAAIVLLAAGRPRWRSFTRAQWRLILALAVAYGTMNLSLYTAVSRLGLGLGMTLEFLGPLSVALASSRGNTDRRKDLACALAAAAGVAVLARPRPSTDYAGIGLGLLAALCWACYILLNRQIGRSIPGSQGSAAAAGVSAVSYVPIGIVVLLRHPPTLAALGFAATAGVLSSAVPLLADLLALRRVPAGYFGMFMSVNPVFAAGVGLVILGQRLSWESWASIAVIVGANLVTT
ncbi:MAG: EamA family transporter, partial [Streptosporangiales bacterium]|nr:EamA family transporter [Streptosporangiales bacterium]